MRNSRIIPRNNLSNCLCLLLLSFTMAAPAPVKADDGNQVNNGSQAKAESNAKVESNSGDSSKAPLQTGVQKVELSLDKLREVGIDLKNLLKAAGSLYDEVTIQPVRIITQPEVVGRGMIINIPVGTVPTGPVAPPKKERVDLAMNNLRPVITMMKTNVDAFVSGKEQLDLSDTLQKQLQPQFDQWIALVNDLSAHQAKLETLTQGPPYDNAAIASQAGVLQSDIKKLDDTRRSIYKVIRKQGNKKK